MRGGGHPDGADQATSPGRPGRPSPQGGVRVPGVRCVWKLGVGRGTLTVKTTSPVTSPGSGSKMRVVPSVHVGWGGGTRVCVRGRVCVRLRRNGERADKQATETRSNRKLFVAPPRRPRRTRRTAGAARRPATCPEAGGRPLARPPQGARPAARPDRKACARGHSSPTTPRPRPPEPPAPGRGGGGQPFSPPRARAKERRGAPKSGAARPSASPASTRRDMERRSAPVRMTAITRSAPARIAPHRARHRAAQRAHTRNRTLFL